MFIKTVQILIGLYLLCALALFTLQRGILFKPDTTIPVISGSTADGYATEAHITTDDNLTLKGWLFEAQSDKPLILFFHGNAGHHGDWTDRALQFQADGYPFIVAGYRGYGGNLGAPSEKAFYKDGQSWLNWARTKFPDREIIVYGISLGSGVASKLAADNDLKAVILEVPYTSIADIGQRRYPLFPVEFLSRDPFDTQSRIKKITEPILIMGAGQDETIPSEHSKALYDLANEPKTLYFEPNSRHASLYDFEGYDRVIAFIESLEN